MPVKGHPHPLHIGRVLHKIDTNLGAALRKAGQQRFDFVALPLAAPNGEGVGCDFQPFVESDLALEGSDWSEKVVGFASESLGPSATRSAERGQKFVLEALETEIRWAAHLGLKGIVLPQPGGSAPGKGRDRCGSYARSINELLLTNIFGGTGAPGEMIISVRVPAGGEGWLEWNRLRTLCDHHSRLTVALELTPHLPGNDRDLERWLGEPVRFVVVPLEVFLLNPSGYPVLPKRYKALVSRLFRQQVQVVISSPADAGAADMNAHLNYIARLFQGLPPPSEAELFCQTHKDCLQAPLQPLKDNLEMQTYELFERDPVKYVQYEEAVLAFLRSRMESGKPFPCTIMVVGAGRGPLVSASLRAAQRASVAVRIYAVEKNPNAIHALRYKKKTEAAWGVVEVINEDMRKWETPHKADALVSELLGSFGDNELSPECLDGAQRFLAPDGVSIPQSYTSSLAPVCAARIWDEVRASRTNPASEKCGDDLEALESCYVVNISELFTPVPAPKDCFVFRHPNWQQPIDNDRAIELTFESETDILIHGFVGYFDSTLYGDVHISIHPQTYSQGMFSWFPLFIPLRTPVFVRKGEMICSHWWRRHDSTKVWYEWSLSEPVATPIHNPGGRSWSMSL
mmetsp:Transcript_19456/g.35270  ORF Transcript_19456/g.35270 Transcript_19456/m.35270 type:complete len:628 (-) Transcript_19456:168-2051(-)